VEALGNQPPEPAVQLVVVVACRNPHGSPPRVSIMSAGVRIVPTSVALPSSPGAGSAGSPSAGSADGEPYRPRRESRSLFVDVRGLRHHVRSWEPLAPPAPAAPAAPVVPTVFLLHGWMDVSASFQFVVDLLPDD